ncbi:MAG: hypothetical protein K2X87_12555, partial [Gemmataceae bacterium]|nr:hypothetical protein [Gemmataceae bacterium]
MPLLVPPISTPATPPLITPAASGAAAVAPENSFGSVLAQAAGADQPASAAAAPTTGIDTTGAGTSVDETADATRVAAEAAAGLFVVAPGVVLSQAGSAV